MMDNNYCDYVVVFHYGSTNGGSALPPSIIPAKDIAAAFRCLLQQPMDQWHPQTALRAGFPHFIDNATVIQLKNLQPVIISDRLDELVPKQSAVWLSVSPECQLEGLGLKPDKGMEVLEDKSTIVPWLSYDRHSMALIPGLCYEQLYEIAIFDAIPPDVTLTYGSHVTTMDCVKLTGGVVKDGELRYESMMQYHFFDSAVRAMAYLLNLPSAYFHRSGAIEKDLDYYILNAQTQNTGSPVRPLAIVAAAIPRETHQGAYQGRPERILCVFEQGKPVIQDLDLARMEVMETDGKLFFILDKGLIRGSFQLKSNGSAEDLVAQLNANHGGGLLEFSFVSEKTKLMSRAKKGAAEERTETILSVHTDSVKKALFELTSHPVSDHNPSAATEDVFETQAGHVRDGDGNIIVSIKSGRDAGLSADGVFLGIHESWIGNPAIAPLTPTLLRQGAKCAEEKKGDLTYFQIGYRAGSQLVPTTGYVKFQLQHKAIVLEELARQRDRATNQRVDSQFANGIELVWAAQITDGRVIPVESFVPCASTEKAMSFFKDFMTQGTDQLDGPGCKFQFCWGVLKDSKVKLGASYVWFSKRATCIEELIRHKRATDPDMAALLDVILQYDKAEKAKREGKGPRPQAHRQISILAEKKQKRPGSG